MRALDNPVVKDCDGFYMASNPEFGALSALTRGEIVLFYLYCAEPDNPEPIKKYLADSGMSPQLVDSETEVLRSRWETEGWTRDAFPDHDPVALATVYFTVTRFCDLACPYCYQGLSGRKETDMTVDRARIVLDKIKAFNARCNIIVTGGEPFTHPDILKILDLIDERELPFTILSNGTQITPEVATRLKSYQTFRYIQVSLDGFSEETFALTRGRAAFPKVIRAIESIIEAKVPFVLAPTMHEGNVHELHDVSSYAVANGGWISPNNLRHLPQDSNKRYLDDNGKVIPIRKVSEVASNSYAEVISKLTLSNETLLGFIADSSRRLKKEFGAEYIAELSAKYSGRSVCSVDKPNANFICGMGHSLVDIDWNGDVYPCHLLKGDELVLGNIFESEITDIFAEVKRREIRVKSYDIPKCSGCSFNSTCGSGCRAGSYFAYGSFSREDDLCEVNGRGGMRKIFSQALSRDPSLNVKVDAFFEKYMQKTRDDKSDGGSKHRVIDIKKA